MWEIFLDLSLCASLRAEKIVVFILKHGAFEAHI